MSSEPGIGTLVVIVLKANHLPNKRHIGKQDPYCVVTVNGEKKRTKSIKRGGQHPEWDEEFRFVLKEAEPEPAPKSKDGTPPPPPPKNTGKLKNIEGGTTMKISCYADDPREPDFIGDCNVDLTEVLTKGECDEWFSLTHKDRFAGKVYLELTFWSNEPAPEKKPSKAPKHDSEYGGKGHFVASGDVPASLMSGNRSSRTVSTSILEGSHHLRSGSIQASTSLAHIDLYNPSYKQGGHPPSVDSLVNEFAEFGVATRRRESFPPPHGTYGIRPSSSGFSTLPSHGYEATEVSSYNYDRPVTPPGHNTYQRGNSMPPSFPAQGGYQSPYDASTSGLTTPRRTSRYSTSTASSGFMPIAPSSGFAPPGEPSGFPASHTPAPSGYSPSHFVQPGFPGLSQTPAPGYAAHPPPFNSMTPAPPIQPYTYHSYAPQAPIPSQHYDHPPQSYSHSAPHEALPLQPYNPSVEQQQYAPPLPLPGSDPHQIPPNQYLHEQPAQHYANYSPHGTVAHEPPVPPSRHVSMSAGRPLPQPQPPVQPYLPPNLQAPYVPDQGLPGSHTPPHSYATDQIHPPGTYTPPQTYPTQNLYQSIPPPPPLPPSTSQPQSPHSPHGYAGQEPHRNVSLPPAPSVEHEQPRRHSSLPQPPTQGQSSFQSLPPPPPRYP